VEYFNQGRDIRDQVGGSKPIVEGMRRRLTTSAYGNHFSLKGTMTPALGFLKRKHSSGDAQMNKDKFEGGVRSAAGEAERTVSAAADDKASDVRGAYDQVAGSAQSAWGSAKEAAKEAADSGSIPDLSRLRDDIAKLTQTVSDLAQKQVASSRDQVAGVVAAAGDTLSQSAAVAQDKFAAGAGDVEARIKKNPWCAVAVAGLIGLLVGKMS
jgi:ElaB/YqjD/DUF883 family membrane-anchored ribosome-binding protein